MVNKEELRLNQRVWYGAERKESTVEMLAQSFVYLHVFGEGSLMTGYEDVYGSSEG